MANTVALTTGSSLLVIGSESNAPDITGSVAATTASSLSVEGVGGSISNVFGVSLRTSGETIAISGVTGIVGTVALTSPEGALRILGLNDVELTSSSSLAISGVLGQVGSVSLRAPASLISATGSVAYLGSVAISTSSSLSASGTTGITGTVAALTRTILAASGHTGIVGSVAITTPVGTLSASGVLDVTGYVTLITPAGHLFASGSTQGPGVTQAFAMHLETTALSTYEGFAFNSMTRFNDVYIAAGPDGIFALTGGTDPTVAPQAVIRSGVTDFGTSHRKRVTDMWVGYTADGDMELRVITDGDTVTTYPLLATGKEGIHGNRVRIGKGLLARYWQWEIVNLQGCNFSFDSIEVRPDIQRRRHGGDDA